MAKSEPKKPAGEEAAPASSSSTVLTQSIRGEIDRLEKSRTNLIEGLKGAAKVATTEGKNELAAELLAAIPSEGKKEPEMAGAVKRLLNELVKLPMKKQESIAKSFLSIVSIQDDKVN